MNFYFMFFFLCFLNVVTQVCTTTVMLILGSNNEEILKDRINTAINFVKKKENVTWFLTGGKKDQKKTRTESDKMLYWLQKENKKEWNYYLDSVATNTAENFLNFKNWLTSLDKNSLQNIYITTSQFHFERANKFAENFLKNQYHWILSPKEYPFCQQDEQIHMQNVEKDIDSVLDRIRF
jgi:hypothetical protein